MTKITHIRKTSDGRFSAEQRLVCIDGSIQEPTQILPMMEDHLLAWLHLRGVDTGYSLRQRLQNLGLGGVVTVLVHH